jgi:prevent-host-death family protein
LSAHGQLEIAGLEREAWEAQKAVERALRDKWAAEAWERDNKPPPPPPAREVSIRELDRRAGAVMSEVTDDGCVIAVTRWGLPVALIVPLADAIRLLPSDYVMSGDLGRLSARFVARAAARHSSELAHGRFHPPERQRRD